MDGSQVLPLADYSILHISSWISLISVFSLCLIWVRCWMFSLCCNLPLPSGKCEVQPVRSSACWCGPSLSTSPPVIQVTQLYHPKMKHWQPTPVSPPRSSVFSSLTSPCYSITFTCFSCPLFGLTSLLPFHLPVPRSRLWPLFHLPVGPDASVAWKYGLGLKGKGCILKQPFSLKGIFPPKQWAIVYFIWHLQKTSRLEYLQDPEAPSGSRTTRLYIFKLCGDLLAPLVYVWPSFRSRRIGFIWSFGRGAKAWLLDQKGLKTLDGLMTFTTVTIYRKNPKHHFTSFCRGALPCCSALLTRGRLL